MSGRGRSSFTKRQKERSRQEKQREKAERKVQRKLEKPATGSDSFELSEEDFAAAAAQMALPGIHTWKSSRQYFDSMARKARLQAALFHSAGTFGAARKNEPFRCPAKSKHRQ